MRTKDITNFVVEELNKLGEEDALSHKALIADVLTNFPNLKTRDYAANRINHILNNKTIKPKFKKIKGKDNKPYIIKSKQGE